MAGLRDLLDRPDVPDDVREAALAEIARRERAEKDAADAAGRLEAAVAQERDYAARLVALNETLMELSRLDSVDELCRRAVKLAHHPLGVSRLGIWLLSPNGRVLTGTYGIDEYGSIRDERGFVADLTEGSALREMRASGRRYLVQRGKRLYDHAHLVVGEGTQISAPLWGAAGVVGMAYADDLLLRRPVSEQDCELVSLFAAVLGHLIVRVRLDERRRQLEAEQQDSRRLESLRIVAAGVAHDLSNALQTVLGYAEMMVRGLHEDAPSRTALEAIRVSAERGATLARRLRLYAGGAPAMLRPLSLDGAIRPVLAEFREQTPAETSVVEEHDEMLPLVWADPSMLRQALLELLANAGEALEGRGGTITVTTGRVLLPDAGLGDHAPDLPEGEWAYLEVSDSGPGVDAQALSEVFDPFYTTRALGRGLGLPSVQGVARAHGGAATVASEPGQGLSARIYLPVARDAEAEQG